MALEWDFLTGSSVVHFRMSWEAHELWIIVPSSILQRKIESPYGDNPVHYNKWDKEEWKDMPIAINSTWSEVQRGRSCRSCFLSCVYKVCRCEHLGSSMRLEQEWLQACDIVLIQNIALASLFRNDMTFQPLIDTRHTYSFNVLGSWDFLLL